MLNVKKSNYLALQFGKNKVNFNQDDNSFFSRMTFEQHIYIKMKTLSTKRHRQEVIKRYRNCDIRHRTILSMNGFCFQTGMFQRLCVIEGDTHGRMSATHWRRCRSCHVLLPTHHNTHLSRLSTHHWYWLLHSSLIVNLLLMLVHC